MRSFLALAAVLAFGRALAQTPPIKPQTPDVKVPPAVELPGPSNVQVGAVLTVSDAVAIALKNRPELTAVRAGVRAAEGRTQQARAGLFPQLGVNGSFSESSRIRGGGAGQQSSGRFQTSLTLDQLLFDFERTRDQVRQQETLERAARHALTAAEQDTAFQVRQAFYDYAESLRGVRIAEANIANRQRSLDLATARLEQGVGAPADVVRAKANLADAVLSLSASRSIAIAARVNLAELMGIDPRTPLAPADSSEPDPGQAEVAELVQTALANRPEVLEARERAAASGFAVAVAGKSNLPRIDFGADFSGRGSDQPLESQTASFGINIRWTFGDGGLTAGRRKEAQALLETARAQLVSVSQAVISDVSLAYVNLRTAEQRLETANVQLANARELLRISEGRYAAGLGQFLEVTDAQATLFSAERNVSAAEADLQRARAALARAVGSVPLGR